MIHNFYIAIIIYISILIIGSPVWADYNFNQYLIAQVNDNSWPSSTINKGTIIKNSYNIDNNSTDSSKNNNQDSLILPLPSPNPPAPTQITNAPETNPISNTVPANNLNTQTDLASNNPAILKLQAQACIKNKDYKTAKLYLKKLGFIRPNNFFAYVQLGNIDHKTNNPISGLKNFAIADYIKPHNFIVTNNINYFGSFIKQNFNKSFNQSYFSYLAHTDKTNKLLCIGNLFYSLGYINEAKDLYTYLLKVNPSCVRAWINLGVIEIVTGNLTLAKALLEKVPLSSASRNERVQGYLKFINQQIAYDQSANINYSQDAKFPLVKVGNYLAPSIFAKDVNSLPKVQALASVYPVYYEDAGGCEACYWVANPTKSLHLRASYEANYDNSHEVRPYEPIFHW